jgi:hypothetical protein
VSVLDIHLGSDQGGAILEQITVINENPDPLVEIFLEGKAKIGMRRLNY